ncbi:glycosyl hydrolase family 8, partial [Synechococcus sp. UW140]|uniref:glycosyl hydrolase family 8 n=1 Tax=Synechococcus sp. UW140 TaxID=368503 RepID=UPI0023544914
MSNYSSYYNAYKASTTYWKPANNFQSYTSSTTTYPVSSGGSSGLVILDGGSTANLGGVQAASESIGYSLLLAAQYNDKTTFDRISAFIQTAMKASGRTLMPWEVVTQDNGVTWQVPPATNPGTPQEVNYSTSASDGDINIALGYVYAYLAASTYGWSPNDSNGNSYYNLAANYIASIRALDFSAKDSNT